MKEISCRPVLLASFCLLLSISFAACFQRTNVKRVVEKIAVAPSKPDFKTHSEIAEYASVSLKRKDFANLDAQTDSARLMRQRLPGGFLKLNAIYRGLSHPNFDQNASAKEWDFHFERLEEWKRVSPASVTPRLALAESWLDYAWEARGTGYANQVSLDNWKLFEERTANARGELAEAEKLGVECPQWYAAMLRVAQAQGWRREQFDLVYEEGFRLEPGNIDLHRSKVTYLLPQWYGKEGDLLKFITEMADRVEGDEGDILYFSTFGMLQKVYRGDIFRRIPASWQRVKSGYEKMKERYGVDRYRKNQFAYLSLYAADFDTMYLAMQEVGDDWDKDVWNSREKFEEFKKVANTYPAFKAKTLSANSSASNSK